MKQFFLIIGVFLLIGCSSSDDSGDGNNSANSTINPPEWILGTWIIEGFEGEIAEGWRFEDDDVIRLLLNTETSYKAIADIDPENVRVTEEITDTSYIFTLTSIAQTINLEFYLVSDMEISNTPNGTGGWTKI